MGAVAMVGLVTLETPGPQSDVPLTRWQAAVAAPAEVDGPSPHVVGGWTVLPVRGEIDALTAPDLQRAILDQLETTHALVIDLSEVTFLDSSGLSVLVSTMKMIATIGGRLKLVIDSPQITTVLQITNLDQVFEISQTVEAATATPPAAG